MDFPNVRFVINYGPLNLLEQYIQQRGRAGRYGLPSTACLCYHGKQLRTADSTMKKYALNTIICRRNLILDELGKRVGNLLKQPTDAVIFVSKSATALCAQRRPPWKEVIMIMKIL